MKTFRFIGMALFAILMCVNFASCSSSDDDPTEEKEEGEVVVSGKKLVKIVGTSKDSSDSETYTFKYDNKGRLIEATESYQEGSYKDTDTYQFIWGDDAIKVIINPTYNYTLTLNNGLVQNSNLDDENGVFTYNNSNRFIKYSSKSKYDTCSAIWDGDKLVSISNYDNEATLTYSSSCKKGYFPFIATMITYDADAILFMAHPEIAGMRTNQLPTSITWTDNYGSETSTFTYEFDKEGYISKIVGEETFDGSTETYTYTLTWQ